jgi:hypothetical protein
LLFLLVHRVLQGGSHFDISRIRQFASHSPSWSRSAATRFASTRDHRHHLRSAIHAARNRGARSAPAIRNRRRLFRDDHPSCREVDARPRFCQQPERTTAATPTSPEALRGFERLFRMKHQCGSLWLHKGRAGSNFNASAHPDQRSRRGVLQGVLHEDPRFNVREQDRAHGGPFLSLGDYGNTLDIFPSLNPDAYPVRGG